MSLLGVLFLVICIGGIIKSFTSLESLNKNSKKPLTRKQFVSIFSVGIFISLVLIAAGNTKTDSVKPPEINKEKASQFNYEILNRTENKLVENINVYINPGETKGEVIAKEIKTTCKKPCNIYLYDDKKAYELQSQYDEMMNFETEPTDLENWKNDNYIFVADHYVGWMEFEGDMYSEYPFKDVLYDEIKSKNNLD